MSTPTESLLKKIGAMSVRSSNKLFKRSKDLKQPDSGTLGIRGEAIPLKKILQAGSAAKKYALNEQICKQAW